MHRRAYFTPICYQLWLDLALLEACLREGRNKNSHFWRRRIQDKSENMIDLLRLPLTPTQLAMMGNWAANFMVRGALLGILLVFTVLPGAAKAHGGTEAERGFSLAAPPLTTDVLTVALGDHSDGKPAHCHVGPECSIQATFVMPPDIAPHRAVFGKFIPFTGTKNTGWLLSFDPPPPRVLS